MLKVSPLPWFPTGNSIESREGPREFRTIAQRINRAGDKVLMSHALELYQELEHVMAYFDPWSQPGDEGVSAHEDAQRLLETIKSELGI